MQTFSYLWQIFERKKYNKIYNIRLMKFIVSSTGLFSHLQAVSRVINSKNSLPILDCFLFELTDGTLNITASDSETTLSTSIEVNEYEGEGRFAVSSKTLLDALKEIPEQP